MFSTLYGTYFSFQMHFKMSSAFFFSMPQKPMSSKMVQKVLNLSQTSPGFFTCLCYMSFENIAGKGETDGRTIKFEIVVYEFFQFESVYYLSFGKGLTHYQTTNFRLLQTERVCRRQFQI